jgi:hypothetical protein
VDSIIAAVPSSTTIDNTDVAITLDERQHFSDLLKEQLAQAQNRMKVQADMKRSHRQFQVGEQVLLNSNLMFSLQLYTDPVPSWL